MMLAVYRKIVGGDTITRISEDRQGFLGCELHGKTVGIIGLGAIGQRVAQLANAFGCKVLGYNRSQKNIAQVTQVDKDQLLSQSDIITLHLPLTAETRHFIDEADFQLMRPHSILINTARGAIVNQNALYNALRKGQIAGAAVDVYDQEPPLPANFELFNAPNLLMLPHIGYATKEAFAIRLGIVIKNVEMWLAGTPQNLIA
jgi:D-3-phosphoglycerate dehydrogenase